MGFCKILWVAVLGFVVESGYASASTEQPIRSFFQQFSSMTDIQRTRWQEENASKHYVAGTCRVQEIRNTNWLSEVKPPEANFVVDCRVNSTEHVALYLPESYEDFVYSLSKEDNIDFSGNLITLKHWGLWNTAYILVSENDSKQENTQLDNYYNAPAFQPHGNSAGEEMSEQSTRKLHLLDSDNNEYEVIINSSGAVLESENSVIYMGNSCDAESPEFGTGTWGWANGGILIQFINRSVGFPRQDSPFQDGRCRL